MSNNESKKEYFVTQEIKDPVESIALWDTVFCSVVRQHTAQYVKSTRSLNSMYLNVHTMNSIVYIRYKLMNQNNISQKIYFHVILLQCFRASNTSKNVTESLKLYVVSLYQNIYFFSIFNSFHVYWLCDCLDPCSFFSLNP